jgi:hypothetical protein
MPRAPLSLAVQSPLARHCAACDSFELGRAFRVRWVASTGVATGDASDRLLHSEPIQLEHPCSVASQRSDPTLARCLAAPSRGESLSYRALRLVLVHAKRLLSRSCCARPETRVVDTGWLGAARCERGRGGSRFTTRPPLRRPTVRYARALSSAARDRMAASDTPVASSVLVGMGRGCVPNCGSEAAKTGSAGAL